MNCSVCLVMAGGRASRMGFVNKPTIKVCGVPMIERVLRVCERVCRVTIVAASKYTIDKDLVNAVRQRALADLLESSGRGYVEDLSLLLKLVRKPTLVLPSDTPFITVESLEFLASLASEVREPVTTLCVECSKPIGISVFRDEGGEWCCICVSESMEFMNINTFNELGMAEEHCNENSWRSSRGDNRF